METLGYYSLIRYCPNLSRLDAASVGLILFVPESNLLQVRLGNNDRVRKFFGSDSFSDDWLEAAKISMKERAKAAGADFQCLEDFQKFINTLANELLLTKPRPIAVYGLKETLDTLFKELVL